MTLAENELSEIRSARGTIPPQAEDIEDIRGIPEAQRSGIGTSGVLI